MSGELIEDLVTVGASLQERDRLREELLVETEQREKFKDQRDRLAAELAAVTLERDEWKTGAEYAQENVRQLRLQVEALEASVEDWQSANKKLAGQVQELQRLQLTMRDLTTARDAAFRIDKFAAAVAGDCGTLVGDDGGRRVEIDPISVITVVLPMVVECFKACREKRRQKQEQQDTPQQQIAADHNNPKDREQNEASIAWHIMKVCANNRREEIKRARRTKLPADVGRWSITRASAERMAAKIHSRAATMPARDAESLCAACGVT